MNSTHISEMCKLIFVLTIIINLLVEKGNVDGGTEAQMRELLFAKLNSSDYSPRVRPIKDSGNALNLYVDLYLVSINKVDEVARKITSTAYLKIVWSDSFMIWEPTDYGNISQFSLPQNEIWKPDITLANAYDTISGLGAPFMYVVVTSDGNITWEPFQVFESICKIDMTHFPFDTHVCNLEMATWSSTQDLINIIPGDDGFDTGAFEENANWYLESVTTFDSSTSLTSSLSFSFTLKRKPVYYIINVIIPIILLSVLNNFVFLLPCDSGEKLTYAIILFLSFAIYLLIVIETMPEEMSNVPIVTVYLLFECVFSTSIVLITAVQLRLHNRGDKSPVPKTCKKITRAVQQVKNKLFCQFGDDKIEEIDSVVPDERVGYVSTNRVTGKMLNSIEIDAHVKIPMEASSRFATGTNGITLRKDNDLESIESANESQCASAFKRKLLCGANGTKRDDIQLNTLDSRFSQTSEKTDLTLSQILGKSNKVEPEIFFRKPKEVYPIYDKTLAMEDADKIERILHENPEDLENVSDDSAEIASVEEPYQRDQKELIALGTETATDEPEPEKKEDIVWPEFVLAVDSILFVLTAIVNTLATIVTFVVSYSD